MVQCDEKQISEQRQVDGSCGKDRWKPRLVREDRRVHETRDHKVSPVPPPRFAILLARSSYQENAKISISAKKTVTKDPRDDQVKLYETNATRQQACANVALFEQCGALQDLYDL